MAPIGYVAINDKPGSYPYCLTAVRNQICKLVDDRFYRVVYLSEVPNLLDDNRSNPVSIFVEPAGNYGEAEKEIAPMASKIQKVVTEDGAAYLGIGKGAIAASSRLLNYQGLINPRERCSERKMWEVTKYKESMHLKLYSGSSCLWTVPGFDPFSTQLVHKRFGGGRSDPFPLFFSWGIFFPLNQNDIAMGVDPVLEYSSYNFCGYYSPTGLLQDAEKYSNTILPCAALTQKAGKGRMLLSGVNPEMGPDAVAQIPVDSENEPIKTSVIEELKHSKNAGDNTMREFLNILSIATKKA